MPMFARGYSPCATVEILSGQTVSFDSTSIENYPRLIILDINIIAIDYRYPLPEIAQRELKTSSVVRSSILNLFSNS